MDRAYFALVIFAVAVAGIESVTINKKSHCIIPVGIDPVNKAILENQCVTSSFKQGNDTVCYEELGCFPMDKPWTTLLRPLPPPLTPDECDVRLYLYSKSQRVRYNVRLWPTIDLSGSDFNPKRVKTVFITHGFASTGNLSWIDDMKNAYLLQQDANVFIVDWGKGAQRINYLQVASNTRIVGAEVGRFVKYLIQNQNLNSDSLHLIGHSLGAHISSYIAKNIMYAKLGKAGRITALDPAQPGFEREAKEVRLDPDDATFVDVIHSDAKPFIPLLGFGMLSPIGHVDLYLNDGTNQPGCYTNLTHHVATIKSIKDLGLLPVEVIAQLVACNHGRSYEVFTASLVPQVPCLWGRKIRRTVNIAKVVSQGVSSILIDPLVRDISKCTQDTCTLVGYLTQTMKARGIFTVSTTRVAPFCVANKKQDTSILQRLASGVFSIGSSITGTITNAAGNIITGVTNLIG